MNQHVCSRQFFEKNSCRNLENCRFCHDLPEEARDDQEQKDRISEKLRRWREKKQGKKYSPAAPLMSIRTKFDNHTNMDRPQQNPYQQSMFFSSNSQSSHPSPAHCYNSSNRDNDPPPPPLQANPTHFSPATTDPGAFLGQFIQHLVNLEISKRLTPNVGLAEARTQC